jgi:hypothetical protein
MHYLVNRNDWHALAERIALKAQQMPTAPDLALRHTGAVPTAFCMRQGARSHSFAAFVSEVERVSIPTACR